MAENGNPNVMDALGFTKKEDKPPERVSVSGKEGSVPKPEVDPAFDTSRSYVDVLKEDKTVRAKVPEPQLKRDRKSKRKIKEPKGQTSSADAAESAGQTTADGTQGKSEVDGDQQAKEPLGKGVTPLPSMLPGNFPTTDELAQNFQDLGGTNATKGDFYPDITGSAPPVVPASAGLPEPGEPGTYRGINENAIKELDNPAIARTVASKLFGEAGKGTPMLAVASVMANRYGASAFYGSSLYSLVTGPQQFVGNRSVSPAQIEYAKQLMTGVLNGQYKDPTGGKQYYRASYYFNGSGYGKAAWRAMMADPTHVNVGGNVYFNYGPNGSPNVKTSYPAYTNR